MEKVWDQRRDWGLQLARSLNGPAAAGEPASPDQAGRAVGLDPWEVTQGVEWLIGKRFVCDGDGAAPSSQYATGPLMLTADGLRYLEDNPF